MKISREDIEQIETRGITNEQVENQLEVFKKGNIPVNIVAAATVGEGIFKYNEEQKNELVSIFQSRKNSLEVLKFVPASGAATRMFKSFHEFLEEFDPVKESLFQFLERKNNTNLKKFFDNIEKLPFYDRAIANARESQPGMESLTREAKNYLLVQTMLFAPGLDLSNFPKGLVPFHNYKNYVATAFEEHLYDAAAYIAVNGVAKLHFTVSQGHKEKFEAEFDQIKDRVTEATHTKFEISYSYQDPKTDTLAVDENLEPFRTRNGQLLFRPGGHGALINNLDRQNADIVFIKNIDNVVLNENLSDVAVYKKMLAGKLLQLQEMCYAFVNKLEIKTASAKDLQELQQFIEEKLFYKFAPGFEAFSEIKKHQKIREILHRPIRVCGMVKNEGEPGGGPFLVTMEDGSQSLQIIEGAQINNEDPIQQELAQNATHFNPVDIVCGLKDYKGKAYDLSRFVDPTTSFIANKTLEGKRLKALELPGLWNGAMAKWNTVFVEVPVSTFNPVKSVTDLLKPSHQAL